MRRGPTRDSEESRRSDRASSTVFPLNKLAAALGRRDERPNVAVAEAIVRRRDTNAVTALVGALTLGAKDVRAKDPAARFLKQDFDEARIVARGQRLAEGKEGEFPDLEIFIEFPGFFFA